MLPQMEYNGQLFIDGWAIHCVIFHNDPGFLYHHPGGGFEKKQKVSFIFAGGWMAKYSQC